MMKVTNVGFCTGTASQLQSALTQHAPLPCLKSGDGAQIEVWDLLRAVLWYLLIRERHSWYREEARVLHSCRIVLQLLCEALYHLLLMARELKLSLTWHSRLVVEISKTIHMLL